MDTHTTLIESAILRTRRMTLTPISAEPGCLANELLDAPGSRACRGCWAGHDAAGVIGWWALVTPTLPDQGPPLGQARLLCSVAADRHGQRLGAEGAYAVLRHGFETLRLLRIFAEADAEDERARRFAERVGMSYVRSYHRCIDLRLDSAQVEYAVTWSRWQAQAGGS